MKKIFMAAALAAAFLIGGNQATAQPLMLNGNYDFVEMTTGWEYDGIVSRNIDFLALRTGPSTNYPMITRIPPGARVEIAFMMGSSWSEQGYRDYDDNFRPVTYNGMRGFAHGGYITRIPGTDRHTP